MQELAKSPASFAKNAPSLVVSLVVHVAIFGVLMMIPMIIPAATTDLLLESVFSEDTPREEIEKQLQLDTKPAETLNVVQGGTPSTATGAAAQPASTPVTLQKANVLNETTVDAPRIETMNFSDEVLVAELGEGEVTGEIGAMVEGYGQAMGIITQEIIRMMRQDKVLVIWLFDESGSLVDDRKEIRENYLRVYDELGIVVEQDKRLRKKNDQLLTVVASYGQTIHEHTRKPEYKPELVKEAIDRIQEDVTGEENMCRSIAEIIRRHRVNARSRKIAVIVVSDESGDDGDYVEEAVKAARTAKAPIYFLGRESMFGYTTARQRVVLTDQVTMQDEAFWLPIRRGPETAYPECLQWDGLHGRWDGQSAGFGPYEQVRMARETGGIFFVLPGEEKDLVGRDIDQRKYDFLAVREYRPLLLERPVYVQERSTSQFRETLWRVIARLNPTKNDLLFKTYDRELNIRREHFPLQPVPFRQEAARQVVKAAKAMLLVDEAIGMLDGVRHLRRGEEYPRWRAGYDLADAQLHMFRLRLFQYLLYMDNHVNNMPAPKNANSNVWSFRRNRQTMVPDEAQYQRLSAAFNIRKTRDEYIQMVAEQEKLTIEMLDKVIQDHPGTPWARRAEREKQDGFGFSIFDHNWNPERRERLRPLLPKL